MRGDSKVRSERPADGGGRAARQVSKVRWASVYTGSLNAVSCSRCAGLAALFWSVRVLFRRGVPVLS